MLNRSFKTLATPQARNDSDTERIALLYTKGRRRKERRPFRFSSKQYWILLESRMTTTGAGKPALETLAGRDEEVSVGTVAHVHATMWHHRCRLAQMHPTALRLPAVTPSPKA
jgi:hypothetical protein